MKKLILFIAVILVLLGIDSCKQSDEVKEIPDACYEASGLYYWTINDVPQEPGDSYEPNTGINSDFVYSIDKNGSWAIYFTNDQYGVTFADFDELITAKEISQLSESEWEALINERGQYAFEYEADGRQELTLYDRTPNVFVGDEASEVVGGDVKLSMRKTEDCHFLVLEVNAMLALNDETFDVKIKVDQPYLY